MRHFAWVSAVILALTAQSCIAGTFTITGNAPDSALSTGACGVSGATLYALPTSAQLVTRIQWSGPSSGIDSLPPVAPNTPFTFSKNVPAGLYTIRVWWSMGQIQGCDSVYSFQVQGPPKNRGVQLR